MSRNSSFAILPFQRRTDHVADNQLKTREQLQRMVQDLQEENKRKDDALRIVEEKYTQWRDYAEELKLWYDDRVTKLESNLECAENRWREAEVRLESRTQEIQVANSFLHKEDLSSETEVVDAVRAINDAILQLASNATDAPEFQCQHPTAVCIEARRAIGKSRLLGAAFLEVLSNTPPQEIAEVLCTALQAVLVEYIHRAIDTWDLVAPPNSRTGILQEIHTTMRGRELQAVAGRWRVLAYTSMKILPGVRDKRRQGLMRSLSNVVVDVLLACGAIGSRITIFETFTRAFESDIRTIADKVLRVHEMIGERILSRELSLFAATPGVVFDPTTMKAESSPTNAIAAEDAGVLCATKLGVISEWREDIESTVAGTNTRDAIHQRCTILKTAVIIKKP